MMDSRPFFSLPRILAELADERIWVYAELVDPTYAPRTGATWTPGYHGARPPPLPCTLLCCKRLSANTHHDEPHGTRCHCAL